MRRGVAAAALLTVLLAGCGEGGSPDEAAPELEAGAGSAEETVARLVESLSSGDFASAVPLAMPDQPALASLAEGATFGQVADALREHDPDVAANFWGGFAQGSGDFLAEGVTVSSEESVTKDGIEYQVMTVLPESGGEREIVAREDDGYRIDLFASFAPGLADRMVGPVERLLSAQTDDSHLILIRLREVAPSLLLAAERPGQPPEVVQAVLRLVELITRVS